MYLGDTNNISIGLGAEKTKEMFENQFGTDQKTRSRKQWKALVNTYGYPTVMEKENMSKAQVKAKCKN